VEFSKKETETMKFTIDRPNGAEYKLLRDLGAQLGQVLQLQPANWHSKEYFYLLTDKGLVLISGQPYVTSLEDARDVKFKIVREKVTLEIGGDQ
jgi:hypothetical protein